MEDNDLRGFSAPTERWEIQLSLQDPTYSSQLQLRDEDTNPQARPTLHTSSNLPKDENINPYDHATS